MSRTNREADSATLDELPDDPDLPFFAYGTLKPGELAYELISECVGSSVEATVKGRLWVRDGIPIFDADADIMSVQGFLIQFTSPTGYRKIADFEPRSFYRWAPITTADGIQANTLVAAEGLRSDRGGGDILWEPWQTAFDPLFRFALGTVAAIIQVDGLTSLKPNDSDPESWGRYYRLQSAYLLTCTILERTAFLVMGAEGNVTARIRDLGRKPEFIAAVETVGLANFRRKVFESNNPTGRAVPLNQPDQFAQWAYQIRNNMVHRGKSSWREAELVRTALIDLHDVLRIYLLQKLPAIREAWGESFPKGASTDWLVKPSLPSEEQKSEDYSPDGPMREVGT